MSEREKDPIFGTKGARMAESGTKSLQDAKRLTLNVSQETAKALYDTLGALLGNERGVKLDIHYGTKTGETGSFTSAFFFVKGIEQRPGMGAAKTYQKKDTSKVAAEIKKIG